MVFCSFLSPSFLYFFKSLNLVCFAREFSNPLILTNLFYYRSFVKKKKTAVVVRLGVHIPPPPPSDVKETKKKKKTRTTFLFFSDWIGSNWIGTFSPEFPSHLLPHLPPPSFAVPTDILPPEFISCHLPPHRQEPMSRSNSSPKYSAAASSASPHFCFIGPHLPGGVISGSSG